MDGLLDLLKRVAELKRAPKTSKGKYPALKSPYKPILLLTVLRRIQQGRQPYVTNTIEFDACFQDFAALYARLYGESSNIESKVTQAFWYLGSGKPKMWQLCAKPGMQETLDTLVSSHAQVKTAGKLTKLIEVAKFADSDWALLSDTDVQQALISFLISEHFPDVRREVGVL